MPTILLKKSDTPGSVPGTANLTNLAGGAEVAVNTADRRMFTMTSASAVVELGNNPTSLNITTGNLAFTGTGQRITGDMSNATVSNRLAFQSSTTNGSTSVNALPNGTQTVASFIGYGSSDPTNTYTAIMQTFDAPPNNLVRFVSGITGTGTYAPMVWLTGGSERMRLDTSGNLGIGTASPGEILHLNASSAPAIRIQSTAGNMYIVNRASSTTMEIFNAANGPLWLGTNNTERMRIDSSGNVGIGGTAGADTKVNVLGTLPTSSNFSFGYRSGGTVPSGTTSLYAGFYSEGTTQATSFTLTNYQHFRVWQNGFGAGSTVTNQYGYYVDSNMTSATNNYGFYSDIASGSNRWNFYANGTAANYFAGNTGFGTTSLTYNVEVAVNTNTANGLRITNANTGSSAASALYFGTDIDGTMGYIAVKSGAGTDANQLIVATRVNHGILFRTNDTNRAYINSGGEFITGGTTDQGAYNLQCNGTGVWGAGAYVNGSDARLKDNIQSLDSGLDVVKAMRPVTFQYKPEYSKDQSVQPGFIAQELQTAMAGKPYLEGVVQEGTNHLNVAYQNIIPILVKAIQELEAKVATLEAK